MGVITPIQQLSEIEFEGLSLLQGVEAAVKNSLEIVFGGCALILCRCTSVHEILSLSVVSRGGRSWISRLQNGQRLTDFPP